MRIRKRLHTRAHFNRPMRELPVAEFISGHHTETTTVETTVKLTRPSHAALLSKERVSTVDTRRQPAAFQHICKINCPPARSRSLVKLHHSTSTAWKVRGGQSRPQLRNETVGRRPASKHSSHRGHTSLVALCWHCCRLPRW